MAEPITIDEIIATLAALSEVAAGDGATTGEIAAERQCSIATSRAMVRAGVQAGVIAATRKRITGIDGVVRLVASYKVVKQEKKKR